MQPGDVIYWHDFQLQKDGEVKNRYFLYLGKSSVTETPVLVNLITTTSKLSHYASGGDREKNLVFRIDRNKYPFFTTDCLIDLNIGYQNVTQDTLNSSQVEIVGKFDLHDLSTIFNRLVDAESVPVKRLREIRMRLEEVECKGLKSVKSNR
ncbi:MAG TPA: hypothetical protein PKC25_03260 [Candidatus Rifleibacterium sp.]|jgi:hypothetical protein|nr:hypothetical protein [Candidatus Rifleibacterium sp.]